VGCVEPEALARGGGGAGCLPLEMGGVGRWLGLSAVGGSLELEGSGLPCGVAGWLRSFWIAAVTVVSADLSRSSTRAVSSSSGTLGNSSSLSEEEALDPLVEESYKSRWDGRNVSYDC